MQAIGYRKGTIHHLRPANLPVFVGLDILLPDLGLIPRHFYLLCYNISILIFSGIVMTKNDILEKLSQEKKFIQETYEVDKIGLFGSYAKGLQKEDSDIDIYVEFKHKTFKNIAGLWIFLEKIYNKKIDLLHKHKQSKGAIFDSIQKEVIYG